MMLKWNMLYSKNYDEYFSATNGFINYFCKARLVYKKMAVMKDFVERTFRTEVSRLLLEVFFVFSNKAGFGSTFQ